MRTISVRILGYKRSQRYSISRALMAAQKVFETSHPDCQIDVQEITTAAAMLQYTPVIAFPSLMIHEELVCVGRFPGKEEIIAWLENELHNTSSQDPIKV